MRVIKHGNKEFIITCDKCGCEFAYTLNDLISDMVYCPECDNGMCHKQSAKNHKKVKVDDGWHCGDGTYYQ